jgi:hypothetical protein
MLQLGIRGLGIARFKFNPISWFLKGEPGAWYDPSDFQPNWRRNLLTWSEDFSNAAWTRTGITQTYGASDPEGGNTATSLKATAINGQIFRNLAYETLGIQTVWLRRKTGVGTVGLYNGSAVIFLPVTSSWTPFSLVLVTKTPYILNIVITSINDEVDIWHPQLEQSSSASTYQKITDGIQDYYTVQPQPVLFQDSAGTIPVTAVEQPVGLMKDKSGRGNHAFQATAGNRPLLSSRVNLLLATATLSTQSVTTVATNYILAFTGAGTVTLSGTATGVLPAGSNTFTATAGTLTLTVSGSVTLADLRPTNAGALLPPYQRVNTASDYDTVGFPLYLKANGTSSAMSTNSVDFSSTDKMTVVTGVRKLSDATIGIALELSAIADSNNGTFLLAPSFNGVSAAGAYYSAGAKGTSIARVTSGATYVAPISNINTFIGSISTPYAELKINGTQVATNTAGQGTGNFGNYPLYLFARAGTSLWFNGQFYGAIIRGAQSDNSSVIQTEEYMAQKTGITF